MGSAGGIVDEGGNTIIVNGEILVSMKLNELREALDTYYGAINQELMGMKVKQIPEKPEALSLYERCVALNMPLVQGGLLDQPHIWIREYEICAREKAVFEANAAKIIASKNGANKV